MLGLDYHTCASLLRCACDEKTVNICAAIFAAEVRPRAALGAAPRRRVQKSNPLLHQKGRKVVPRNTRREGGPFPCHVIRRVQASAGRG